MKPVTFVSAVIYVRNRQRQTGEFLLQLDQLLHALFATHEIIVVDDASTDATRASVFAVKDRVQGNVTLVSLAGRHGVDTALKSGTDLAIGDIIYEIEDLTAPLAKDLFAALYDQTAIQGAGVAFARPGNILRLATRKGLYAMERLSLPAGRGQAYRNSGVPTAEVRHPALRRNWRREIHQLLALLPVNREYPWMVAAALLLAAWAFWFWPHLLSDRRALTALLLVLLTIDLTIGLLARQGSPADKYKVREIQRINRY